MQIFEIEELDNVLVITPQQNLTELQFDHMGEAAMDLLGRLDPARVKHVVLDFHLTDYYGSTAVGFFLRIWKRVRACGGHMAFCHVSEHEQEILKLTKLHTLWDVCETRDEALRCVLRQNG